MGRKARRTQSHGRRAKNAQPTRIAEVFMTIEAAAQILAEARRLGKRLVNLPPALRPGSIEDAYAIQTAVAQRLGPVGGWKVGAESDGSILVAPIPAAYIHRQDVAPPVPAPARLEAEFAVLIGKDLPAGPFQAADMPAAVAQAHVVIEVLEHRFIDRAAVSALTALADGNGNGRVIIGDLVSGWRDLDLAALDVRLAGAAGSPGADTARLWGLLAALADHAARTMGGLTAGQIVITGARAGPITLPAGPAAASINGVAHVRVTVGAGDATPPPP